MESKKSQTVEKIDTEIIESCDVKQEEKISTNVDSQPGTETSLPANDKTEKAPKVDICDTFMEANAALQSLCNSYSKILKSFKDSKEELRELRAENKRIKDETEDLKEQLEDIREKERQGRIKIHSLENQIEQHIITIEEKNKTISEKEGIIKDRNSELEGRDKMIEMLNKDLERKVDEFKKKLAFSLKLDYQDFLECIDYDIKDEVGKIIQIQLGDLFEMLKKEGIPIGD